MVDKLKETKTLQNDIAAERVYRYANKHNNPIGRPISSMRIQLGVEEAVEM